MKTVFVFPNEKKDAGLVCTRRVIEYLRRRDCRICGPEGLEGADPITPAEKGSLDFAVMLGGDGTILRGAHYLLGTDTPILGINLGTLGYMAEVEPESLEEALEKVLRGDFQVERRLVLGGVLTSQKTGERHCVSAINEFVLHRNDMAGVLDVRVFINDTYIETYRTDGIIVATPNGSTAYNFSAGGPVLSPVADNMILTPLCSHSILDRSVVITGEDRVSLEVCAGPDQELPLFSADGIDRIRLDGPCRLDIQKSPWVFPLIRVSPRNFFEVLRMKMIQ